MHGWSTNMGAAVGDARSNGTAVSEAFPAGYVDILPFIQWARVEEERARCTSSLGIPNALMPLQPRSQAPWSDQPGRTEPTRTQATLGRYGAKRRRLMPSSETL